MVVFLLYKNMNISALRFVKEILKCFLTVGSLKSLFAGGTMIFYVYFYKVNCYESVYKQRY